MGGMRTEHLTADELEALSRGEDLPRDAGKHLSACATCREAAREGVFATRYVRPLAADHPDEDVLTALWSGALPTPRQLEVRRHVDACSRCQALLARLRRATPARARPESVSAAAMEGVRRWAVASTEPRRATLFVVAAEGLQQLRTFLEKIGEPLEELGSPFAFETGILRSATAYRMSRAAAPTILDEGAEAESEPPIEPTTLFDGRRTIRFEARSGPTGTQLVISVSSSPADSESVAARLQTGRRDPQRAEIAAGGEAVFDLDPGISRLSLGLRPLWKIEIRFDA